MKAIKASHHDQILRLSNDDAALLVSSGRWVYISKFEAREATLKPRRPRRGIILFAALAVIALGLLWAGTARAANLPVPFRVCLTQEQAIATYKGKKIGTPRYREIKGERCWYVSNKVAPRSEFIPRATGVAAKPARLPSQETSRAQAVPIGSIPIAGDQAIEFDAVFEALCGGPCRDFSSFDMWVPQPAVEHITTLTFQDRWRLK
jgi:hypothetical protein